MWRHALIWHECSTHCSILHARFVTRTLCTYKNVVIVCEHANKIFSFRSNLGFFWWILSVNVSEKQSSVLLKMNKAPWHSFAKDLVVNLHSLRSHLVNTYTAKPICWNGWISDRYCSLKPLCSGMGEVVPARTSPTLLPPSPRTVLSLSCFKVSQCINCRDWHCKS